MTITEEQIRDKILEYTKQKAERRGAGGGATSSDTDMAVAEGGFTNKSVGVIKNALEERRVALFKKIQGIDAELLEVDFLIEGGLEEMLNREEENRDGYIIAEKELEEKVEWKRNKTKGQTKIT